MTDNHPLVTAMQQQLVVITSTDVKEHSIFLDSTKAPGLSVTVAANQVSADGTLRSFVNVYDLNNCAVSQAN
jgi:hypothetical protein